MTTAGSPALNAPARTEDRARIGAALKVARYTASDLGRMEAKARPILAMYLARKRIEKIINILEDK